MERLLADAEKLSGQKYNISSLKDVYEAIHTIQVEMGIYNTTAKEAAGTIEGSVGSMKAAWENLLTAFGSSDMPIDTFAQNLVASISGAAGNVVPRIGEIIKSIGTTFPGLVSDLFTNLKDTIMENDLGTTVLDGIDSLVTNGANVLQEILSGILEGSTLTDLISRASSSVGTVVESILEVLGSIDIGTVANILNDLVNKIIGGISELISSDGAADMLDAVIKAVLSIIENLANNVGPLANAVLTLATNLVTVILDNLDDIINVASDIVQTLLDAILKDDGILDGALKLVTALADGLIENSDVIFIALQELLSALWDKELDPETVEKITEVAASLIKVLAEAILATAGSALGFLVSMFEMWWEKLLSQDWAGLGKAILDGITGGLFSDDGRVSPVDDFAQAWADGFVEIEEFITNFLDGIEKFKEQWSEFWADMAEKLVEKVETFKENIQKIPDKIKELVEDAKNWGKDMIQNFINGITSNIPNLSSATTKIADTVSKFIHFSEPDEGPLSDFHTYAPDMMKLFASGIEDNAYMIEDAFDKSLDFGTVSASGSIQRGGTSSGAVNGTFMAELLNVLHEILNAVKEGKTISVSAIDSALGQLQSFDERTDFA